MTFEEMADIIGSGMDYVELEMKLQRMTEQGTLRCYLNEQDVRVFSLQAKEKEA